MSNEIVYIATYYAHRNTYIDVWKVRQKEDHFDCLSSFIKSLHLRPNGFIWINIRLLVRKSDLNEEYSAHIYIKLENGYPL